MADTFKVLIELTMATNALGVIGALSKDLGGIQKKMEELGLSAGRLGAAMGGAFAVWGGIKILEGLKSLVEQAKELNSELEKTKQLGGDFAEHIDATRKNSIATTFSVPTSTASGNVKMSREIGVAIGHPEEADAILPFAAKLAAVASNYTGENKDEMILNIVKTAEARGQIFTMGADGKEHVDPVKLQKEMDAEYKGLVLGGGMTTSADFLNVAKQGGPAVKSMAADVFFGPNVEAMVAMGAQKFGTSLMSLFQQFIGGTMTKKVGENLITAGILTEQDVIRGPHGAFRLDPKSAAKFKPLQEDPVAWAETGEGAKGIANFAAKEGITQMQAVFSLFGRQTVERLMSDLLSNKPQFERAREMYGHIQGVEPAYKEQMANNVSMNVDAFQATLKTFMEVLGATLMPTAIKILQDLTAGIQYLTKAVVDHPDAAKNLLLLAGAVGGLAVIGGTLTLGAVFFGPLLTMGGWLAGPIAAAAGVGATGIGAALTALGVAVAPFAIAGGIIVGFAAILGFLAKLGSDAESAPNRLKMEQNRKDMTVTSPTQMETHDGYDASGNPVPERHSWNVTPASQNNKQIAFVNHTYLDGRQVASNTNYYNYRTTATPATGPSDPGNRGLGPSPYFAIA